MSPYGGFRTLFPMENEGSSRRFTTGSRVTRFRRGELVAVLPWDDKQGAQIPRTAVAEEVINL